MLKSIIIILIYQDNDLKDHLDIVKVYGRKLIFASMLSKMFMRKREIRRIWLIDDQILKNKRVLLLVIILSIGLIVTLFWSISIL